MNSLLILPDELVAANKAVLFGERARYAIEIHRLVMGTRTRAAKYGGLRGYAVVEELTQEQVVLSVNLDQQPLPELPLTVLLAIPRPQTVKKVLSLSAMYGISEVIFFRGERSDKSYMQSKTLQPIEVQQNLILGLEQVWNSVPPRVSHHHSLSIACSQLKKEQDDQLKLIVDLGGEPVAKLFSSSLKLDRYKSTIVLIGPELGWSERELELAASLGFERSQLGERALRVEFALAAFLAVLEVGGLSRIPPSA